ncbi:MAG: hypothetical protein LUE27_00250 [Clostridia bacterium]|nr:hypothetical protein [Clostridia bacterium]
MLYTVDNGVLSLTVNSKGGCMTSLKYLPENEERLWQGGPAWKSQDVVIFPVIGHAGEFVAKGETFKPRSHGVARYAEFTLAEKTDSSVTLSLESDENTLKEYPYGFFFSIKYTLAGNTMEVKYSVRSKEGRMPFYVGGHPGMKAPGGSAVIEFENTENPIQYPIDSDQGIPMKGVKRFIASKAFFAMCATLQLGSLSGGKIYARTEDGYRYSYQSDCPLFAFWTNPEDGDYICVEPWWGINDYPTAPREITLKPFMNFTDEKGSTFSYRLTIEKMQ